MANKFYYLNLPLEGYKDPEGIELAKELEDSGFKFKLFEGGGGGEGQEIVHRIIAYLSVHEFWVGFFSSLAASQVEKVLLKFFEWHSRNKVKDNDKLPPLVVVNLYPNSSKRNEIITLDFDIRRKYAKNEIKNKIKNANKL